MLRSLRVQILALALVPTLFLTVKAGMELHYKWNMHKEYEKLMPITKVAWP